jgi:hypothetical protein
VPPWPRGPPLAPGSGALRSSSCCVLPISVSSLALSLPGSFLYVSVRGDVCATARVRSLLSVSLVAPSFCSFRSLLLRAPNVPAVGQCSWCGRLAFRCHTLVSEADRGHHSFSFSRLSPRLAHPIQAGVAISDFPYSGHVPDAKEDGPFGPYESGRRMEQAHRPSRLAARVTAPAQYSMVD